MLNISIGDLALVITTTNYNCSDLDLPLFGQKGKCTFLMQDQREIIIKRTTQIIPDHWELSINLLSDYQSEKRDAGSLLTHL